MNKVYGTMSVGMLITFLAAWAIGNNAAMMETLFTGMTRWIVMFAPLIMVFAFGAVINKLSAAAAQLFFYTFAAVMGVSISYIFRDLHRFLHRAGIPDHGHCLCRPVALGLHHQERHLRLGQLPDHGRDRSDRCFDHQHLPRLPLRSCSRSRSSVC